MSLIALSNTWNRMNVITQQPAGGYQPGQFGYAASHCGLLTALLA
jgi:hypothetical protein